MTPTRQNNPIKAPQRSAKNRATNVHATQPARANAPAARSTNDKPSRIPSINPDSDESTARRSRTNKKRLNKRQKTVLIGLAAAVLVGLVVWLTLPAFSLKFASSQSGITASTPYFIPEGYTLKFPIQAEQGKVILTYTTKQDHDSFTISQEASLWDSQSVKRMVDKQTNGRYLTTSDRGLTIYTYGGNAAWVNRGILYKIHGNDSLSSETLTRIASSF